MTNSGDLPCAALDARAQGREFAADFGGATAGRRDAFGPALLERLTLDGEVGLGTRERRDIGSERDGFGLDVRQFVGQPRRLGLERRDHRLIDAGVALAFEVAAALAQHRHQAAGPFPQRLEAHERVADVVAAHRRQLRLGRDHRAVELAEAALERGLVGRELRPAGDRGGETAAQRRELAPGEVEPQAHELR